MKQDVNFPMVAGKGDHGVILSRTRFVMNALCNLVGH